MLSDNSPLYEIRAYVRPEDGSHAHVQRFPYRSFAKAIDRFESMAPQGHVIGFSLNRLADGLRLDARGQDFRGRSL